MRNMIIMFTIQNWTFTSESKSLHNPDVSFHLQELNVLEFHSEQFFFCKKYCFDSKLKHFLEAFNSN